MGDEIISNSNLLTTPPGKEFPEGPNLLRCGYVKMPGSRP